MTDDAPRKPWGVGRVAFMGRLDAIRAGIQRGLPLTAIYEEHKAALGIGYPSFVKLVGRYADDARVTRRRPRRASEAAPGAPPARPATPPAERQKGSSNAGLDRLRRPAEWNPEVTPEDRKRLTGEKD